MRHVMVELSIAFTAATLVASMVLAAGAAIEPPPQPILLPNRPGEYSDSSQGRCLTAPVTSQSAPGAVGYGTLCYDGRALRATLRVAGLAAAESQAVWLLYGPRRPLCPETPCPPVSLLGDSQGGLMEHIGTEVTSPSGDLELRIASGGVRIQSGMEASVLLSSPHEKDWPHARADFVIP
jgi:hypothetical protein